MRCVQIEAVGPEAHKVFRLDAVAVTLPKWARMCDWTPHDDAMLLLGIYWCATWRPSESQSHSNPITQQPIALE
jgi:hypothetical protein